MTDRYLNFIPFIFKWEGTTYEDVPGDPGGPTKFGIDSRSHPNVNIRNLTQDGATQIYFDSYWTPAKCEEMAMGLGECHMDSCVNCGLSRSATFLANCNSSASQYIALREAFYKRLANARPSLKKFLRGWLNRTEDLKTYLRLK